MFSVVDCAEASKNMIMHSKTVSVMQRNWFWVFGDGLCLRETTACSVLCFEQLEKDKDTIFRNDWWFYFEMPCCFDVEFWKQFLFFRAPLILCWILKTSFVLSCPTDLMLNFENSFCSFMHRWCDVEFWKQFLLFHAKYIFNQIKSSQIWFYSKFELLKVQLCWFTLCQWSVSVKQSCLLGNFFWFCI